MEDFSIGGALDGGEQVSMVPYEPVQSDQTLSMISQKSKGLIHDLSDLYIGDELTEKFPFITQLLDAETMTLGLLSSQLRFTKHLTEQQFHAIDRGGFGLTNFKELEKFIMLSKRCIDLMHEFQRYVRSVPGYLKSIEAELSIQTAKTIVVNGERVNNTQTKQIGSEQQQIASPDDIQYKGTKDLIDEIEAAMVSAEVKREEIGDVTVSNGKQRLSWRIAELEDEGLTKEEIQIQLEKDNSSGIEYEDDLNQNED